MQLKAFWSHFIYMRNNTLIVSFLIVSFSDANDHVDRINDDVTRTPKSVANTIETAPGQGIATG